MTTSSTYRMPTVPPDPAPGNGRATAGFCLAVAGLVLGFLPVFGFLVTVPALLLSRSGRRRFRDGVAGPGFSTAGTVLAWIGTGICALMTVLMIAGSGEAAPQPVAPQPVAPPAPVLLSVPNVVGMADLQARDTLRAAGFTNVLLGPSTGAQPGVAAGTVTTQLPGAAALASAGDPITLGEASAPPAPVVVPPSAPVTQAAQPLVAADPDVDVDRPRTVTPQRAAAAPRAAAPRRAAEPERAASGGSASYANCTAARNAGAAPLYRGQAGYSSHLDRDDDGVACE